jgi:hypothetical protein
VDRELFQTLHNFVTAEPETLEGDKCPNCGVKNDAVRGEHGEKGPTEGDISICLYCTALAVFTDTKGHVRLPTPEEQVILDSDPTIQRMLKAARAITVELNHERS